MPFKKLSKHSLTSQMERNVKKMLKLIEEDGDSFAQKAEMYYQKRPEMISLVEEFSRCYKLMAERCDYSDNGCEPNSTWPSSSPRMAGRRISSSRAAGFDFFLGSSFNGNVGNNMNGYYEASNKAGDGSSNKLLSNNERTNKTGNCSNHSSMNTKQTLNPFKRVRIC